MSHHELLPFHRHNRDSFFRMGTLMLPPSEGLPVKINTYEDVPEEPKFDPKLHLDLQRPRFIRVFPDFERRENLPDEFEGKGSPFAYSAPFQVLSQEGVSVTRDIISRNFDSCVGPESARGPRYCLRGAYYLSPFIRDLQNCQELLDFFEEFVGEPLVPHCTFSNVPHINVSIVGDFNMPLDPWHWDSVAYTGVILLNDMDDMVGGELELMKMEKFRAMEELAAGNIVKGVDTEVINYESPGKMILAQGSEVLHHVTPVLGKSERISMVIAYTPSNCYQPTKSILATMKYVDSKHHLGNYEFFREKAWQCGHALEGYCHSVKYSNGRSLAPHLRAVAAELIRSSDLLEEKDCDSIKFYDPINKIMSEDFVEWMRKQNDDGTKKEQLGEEGDVGERQEKQDVQ